MKAIVRKFVDWWNEIPPNPAPRGRWITTQMGIVIIFGLSLWASFQESNARQEAFRKEQAGDIIVNCQQRVDAVNSIRVVFLDVYDFAEEEGSQDFTELRERLDIVLPPLTMENCLSQYAGLDGDS